MIGSKGLLVFAGSVAVAGTAWSSNAATEGNLAAIAPHRALSSIQTQHVAIIVTPRVVPEYDSASITVNGLAGARSVEVRMLGASGIRGTLLPWIKLHRQRRTWRARLPQPVLPGIYPIKLRSVPSHSAQGEIVYARVYDGGTDFQPLFVAPEEVAAWWATQIAGGSLVAVRRWHRTDFDHRLSRLHRVFVIAYDPSGHPASPDKLGAWITAVKEGYHGKWHLLEASTTPP